MIDTIKLELQQHMYTILDHTKFTPSTKAMFGNGPYNRGSITFSKQNPKKKDKTDGIYKPRLTIVRRPLKDIGYQNTLYIEVSLPKLVFGNNFDELTDSDFEKVINKLRSVLKEMGVYAYENPLKKAQVSAIHYGKNLILDDYTTPYTYIKELKNIDIRKTYDVNQTDYRNGGLSYKFHTNIFEFAFYDKVKELEKSKFSEKRSLSKDDYCQLSLLDLIDDLDKINNPFEVLRLEMRLNKRKKITQQLKKLGLNETTTFEYLYNQDLAKQMLLSFCDSLFNQYISTQEKNSALETFEKLKIANPKINDGKLLELCSTLIMIEEVGVREFRNNIEDKTWYRIKKQIKELSQKENKYLSEIRKQLDKFKPVALVDYPQLLLNNVNHC